MLRVYTHSIVWPLPCDIWTLVARTLRPDERRRTVVEDSDFRRSDVKTTSDPLPYGVLVNISLSKQRGLSLLVIMNQMLRNWAKNSRNVHGAKKEI